MMSDRLFGILGLELQYSTLFQPKGKILLDFKRRTREGGTIYIRLSLKRSGAKVINGG